MQLTSEQHNLVVRLDKRLTTFPEHHWQGSYFYPGNLAARQTREERNRVFGHLSIEMWDCGTSACLAGHAILAADGWAAYHNSRAPLDPGDIAKDLLGLSYNQADTLFAPAVTEASVRRVVSLAAETGNWDHIQDHVRYHWDD